MIMVLPLTLLFASLGAALLSTTTSDSRAARASKWLVQAEQLAQAGALRAIGAIEAAVSEGAPVPVTQGTEAAPILWGSGSSRATITEVDDGVYSVLVIARAGRLERQVEVVVEVAGPPVYNYAIFAGNRSLDPTYELRLSGSGASADEILGNVYSSGDVTLDGDANVTGSIRATGIITGGTGTEGATETIPDIAGMDYSSNHDYDVAALFATATRASAPLGGTAEQLPPTNPAHIFRRDPDDRRSRTSGTVKRDYFLEDPYERVGKDRRRDGSNPSIITLSGDSGFEKVFYIDGDLWLDNEPEASFQFRNESGDPVRVTFVVRGNIHFGDNLFYENPVADAVAFVAIADPAVPDSGNILFGDPSGGTLKHMSAFMFAENDFIDRHLHARGSNDVRLHGNMTANNQVRIERDYFHRDGTSIHSKLSIDFDDRIANGSIALPGLPGSDPTSSPISIRMWRHAGVASHH